MGYTEIGQLIDRVLQDQTIRDLLRKDPKKAAEKCGITLTSSELEAVKKVDWNLSDAELKSRISKGA
jgi:hypothetical protein